MRCALRTFCGLGSRMPDAWCEQVTFCIFCPDFKPAWRQPAIWPSRRCLQCCPSIVNGGQFAGEERRREEAVGLCRASVARA